MIEPKTALLARDSDRRWLQLVAPADYRNPTPQPRYHLVVIGAGPAGLVTAIAAAGLGAKVALIEKHRMGGDCLNVGCIPSKTLLAASGTGDDDFAAAFARMRATRAAIAEHDSVERYTAAGVDVFLGQARFINPSLVRVGELELNARRVVIATGARAAMPPIPGLSDANALTNDSGFELAEKPDRIAIIGAGPIGCELAQVFARLNVKVDLLEAANRILPGESEPGARVVQSALAGIGVNIRLGARIERVENRGSQTAVITADATVIADKLLVATGRVANTEELNLAAAGVRTDDNGIIVVDHKLRTTHPQVFAAGDVCTEMRFTHHADAHARAVVQNALFLPTARVDRLVVPRCVYTQPEIAQIGPTRDELDLSGRKYDTYSRAYAETDHGRTHDDDQGFIEVLTAPGKAEILGATIVGADAGEQIAFVCLAMANQLGVDAFGKGLLAYPTRAEAFRRIADDFRRKRLTPGLQAAFRRWFQWTA